MDNEIKINPAYQNYFKIHISVFQGSWAPTALKFHMLFESLTLIYQQTLKTPCPWTDSRGLLLGKGRSR